MYLFVFFRLKSREETINKEGVNFVPLALKTLKLIVMQIIPLNRTDNK